ncbi:hypothetical protein D3C80_1278720 [compost metagenome]
MLAFDFEGQCRRADLWVQAILTEVVAVKGDIQCAQRRIVAQFFKQGLGNPHTAGTDTDVARFCDVATSQVGVEICGHLTDQVSGIG